MLITALVRETKSKSAVVTIAGLALLLAACGHPMKVTRVEYENARARAEANAGKDLTVRDVDGRAFRVPPHALAPTRVTDSGGHVTIQRPLPGSGRIGGGGALIGLGAGAIVGSVFIGLDAKTTACGGPDCGEDPEETTDSLTTFAAVGVGLLGAGLVIGGIVMVAQGMDMNDREANRGATFLVVPTLDGVALGGVF